MKIVLFTPALKVSAIGRVACLVTHELTRRGHEVAVIRSEDEGFLNEDTHDFGVESIAWTQHEAVNCLAAGADIILYQIGDSYPFHRGCLEWLPFHPGIVCLHDFYIGNLFLYWGQARRAEAEKILKCWYGNDAPVEFFAGLANATFMDKAHAPMPMTEWVCAMATGVITHSNWGINRVRDACPGPVRVVPLAYDAGSVEDNANLQHGELHAGRLNLLTVGPINANKRASSVIRAVGSSPLLRRRVAYQLVGPIQDATARELISLAESLDVTLSIAGEVDGAVLNKAFHVADIVCCLRWPSLEAASASTIEAMLHGKAVVVTDTGFYRELPDDCVIKIDPMNEIEGLRTALERLCADDNLRLTLGERSYGWSATTFTAENYAEQIVSMASVSARTKPILDAVYHFSSVMASWGSADVGMDQILAPLQLFQDCVSQSDIK